MGKIKAALIFFVVLEVASAAGLFFVFSDIRIPATNPVALNPVAVQGNNIPPKSNAIAINNNDTGFTAEGNQNQLQNPPKIVKAVYVTANSAGSNNFINYLIALVKNTEINAAVIDLKDDPGHISFETDSKIIKSYNTQRPLFDVSGVVKKLHAQGIYLIARIAVFKDQALIKSRPDLAVSDNKKSTKDERVLWRDAAKMNWLDPASQEVWNYNIALAQSAIAKGFDEVNFDYIRFPADGIMDDASFPFWDQITPSHIIIRNFFQKLREGLPNQKLSVDLFGYSAIVPNDVGIGQHLEDAFDYFDYLSPMVYPSHYHPDFLGYKNPAEYPYEVIKYTLDQAVARQEKYNLAPLQKSFAFGNAKGFGYFSVAGVVSSSLKIWVGGAETGQPQKKIEAKFRPWLQDFNLGADYTADMVKKEIKATTDGLGTNFAGYMLWNPSNVYTQAAVARAATATN